MASSPVATLVMVNVDCADPGALAAFYAGLLGWEVVHSEGDYAMITGDGATIGFGRVEGFTPPSWPDAGAKQYHLDFRVDDLAEAEATAQKLGATVPEFQPGADRWRVLLDPAGHPFCLCPPAPGS